MSKNSLGKTALVLGAGIGGLSAAIQLAHRGFTVTILEKNSQPGGKIGELKKDGFTFHTGASFIMFPQIYQDFFSSVGADLDSYINLRKMGDTTTFHFADGKSFVLATDSDTVRNRIKAQFPGEEFGYDRFMEIDRKLAAVLYDGPNLARRNYHHLLGLDFLLDPLVLRSIPHLYIHKTWKQLVDSCFRAPELKLVFSYQATFVGMPPDRAMGAFSMITWSEIAQGMYHVNGGVYGIIKGFTKLAGDRGVKIVCDSEVTGLRYEGRTLKGVDTTAGPYDADVVVSNIDGAYFYTHLMPADRNRTFTETRLRRMHHTNSYFTLNLGIKQPIPELSHHTFFVGRDWEDYFRLIFTPDSVPRFTPDNTCYYAMQRSELEPQLAPRGKASLFLLFPVCGYDPGFDWDAYEPTFRNFVYDLMEKRDGIPIRDLIEVEEIYSPARWGREFNLWENVILSFMPTFFQSNGFRMPNKSREFDNLYFAGSSTIPGPGVPTCITSGELAAQRIGEDWGISAD